MELKLINDIENIQLYIKRIEHKVQQKHQSLVNRDNNNLSQIKQKEIVNELQEYQTLLLSALEQYDFVANNETKVFNPNRSNMEYIKKCEDITRISKLRQDWKDIPYDRQSMKWDPVTKGWFDKSSLQYGLKTYLLKHARLNKPKKYEYPYILLENIHDKINTPAEFDYGFSKLVSQFKNNLNGSSICDDIQESDIHKYYSYITNKQINDEFEGFKHFQINNHDAET